MSDDLRDILKKVADKRIRAEDAVAQIYGDLKLSNIGSLEEIRRLVQEVVTLGTDENIKKVVKELLKIYQLVYKPSPSPIPTATIVFPRK